MLTSSPSSAHVTNPDMVHVRHMSEVAEWMDGTVGGGGKQEDRQKGEQEDRKV